MTKLALSTTLIAIFLIISFSKTIFSAEHPGREVLLMDKGWKFNLGHICSPESDFGYGMKRPFAKAGEAYGALAVDFNDSTWRTVDLPHDWVAELGFVNTDNFDIKSHGYKPVGREYPENSIGWYRKSFTLPESDRGRRISLKFDGIFRDSEIWVNGHLIHRNLSGYLEVIVDITDYVVYAKKNYVVVRADASKYEGWFYEGAGIYRHVWLIKNDPLHFTPYGIFVYSDVKGQQAKVSVESEIKNQGNSMVNYSVISTILDAEGKKISSASMDQELEKRKTTNGRQVFEISNPHLWDLDDPYLYTLVSEISMDGKVIDRRETKFGIRTLVFDKDKGFFLNGRFVKIQGVCCHQDHAGVGSALPDRLQYYRIEKLKEMGVNAYRTSHNPPTPELLDACDKLGMLVMDENRLLGSAPEFENQLKTLVKRDRNHPSVFLWSIGNEEWCVQWNETGRNLAVSMTETIKELDPTRLITYGGNNGKEYTGINSVMEMRGFNYCLYDIDIYRKEHPEQILIGSEVSSMVSTRGEYKDDTVKGYLRDYDINKPEWGSTAEYWWKFFDERAWLMGGFVWTGFDYRGEPTPYSWPCINSHFGIMDMCGFPKNTYYYYQSWWTDKDVLHLFPHWNWTKGDSVSVWCFTNCQEAELFVNGKSAGKKTVDKNGHLEWEVVYEPGYIEVQGVRNGKTLKSRVETTGKAVKLKVEPDRLNINADGEDVCIINIKALDDQGRDVQTANNLLGFELVGKGKILGVGNGDPSCHEADICPDGNWKRSLFNGKAQIIIQAEVIPGTIELKISSPGLETNTAVIHSGESGTRPRVE